MNSTPARGIGLCHAAGHVGQRTQISYPKPRVDMYGNEFRGGGGGGGAKEKFSVPRDSIWPSCDKNLFSDSQPFTCHSLCKRMKRLVCKESSI